MVEKRPKFNVKTNKVEVGINFFITNDLEII